MDFLDPVLWQQILASTIRVSIPLVFAAMGGLLSERSGVINIALEGKMLVGAFAAGCVAHWSGSPWVGMLGGAMAGALAAAVYSFFVIELRANQIVAGTAINMLAVGLTPFFLKVFYDNTGASPTLDVSMRLTYEPIVLGAALVLLIAWAYSRTQLGLWLQFAGEKPQALEAAGVSVRGARWTAVLLAGVLSGLGGATLAICLSSGFTRNMTAGRGFMALAALIFGKWRPIPAALACLFFGFTDAIQIRLQGVGDVPVQAIQMIPYLATVLVLAGFFGLSRAPSSLGVPYRK